VSVGGRAVDSWDDIVDQLRTAQGPDVTLTFADSSRVVVSIPDTDVGDRDRVAEAVLPWLPPVIGQIIPSRPGERAGLLPGDTVVAIDSMPLTHWYQLLDLVEPAIGRPLKFTLGRATGRTVISVTPQAERTVGPDGVVHEVGKIGIGPDIPTRSEPFTFFAAIIAGGRATLHASTTIVSSLRGLVSGQVDRRQVGGPILIAQLAGQQARQGLAEFVFFMAVVSVNLAILNLLPIPVLDGGQFMFLLAEVVLRRPLSLRLRERLTLVGLVLIGCLMIFAFWNDLSRNWVSIVGYLRQLVGG
jgi:regulator of sigma E protease